MKKSIFFLFTFLIPILSLNAQSFELDLTEPQPGETIQFKYDPTGSDLEGQQVNAIAYSIEVGKTPVAYDVPLNKTDLGYIGKFDIPSTAKSIFVKFLNDDETLKDNNKDLGYHSMLYKNSKPLPNAYAAISSVYSNYAGLFGVSRNAEKAKKYFDKAKAAMPNKIMDEGYIVLNATVAQANKDKAGITSILNHVKQAISKDNLSESLMSSYARVAGILKDGDLSKSINEKLKVAHPNGMSATMAKYSGFRKLESLDEKVTMFKEAKSKLGGKEDFAGLINNMARTLATEYGEKEDFEKMESYASMLSNGSDVAGVYNNLAWQFSGESIEGEGRHMEKGREISKKSLDLLKTEMKEMKSRPEAYSPKQWKRIMGSSLGMYADTYALLAYKLGDAKNAAKYQKIAIDQNKMRDAEMNERYAVYLEKDQGVEKAMHFLEKAIAGGTANAAMKSQFTSLFKSNVTIDQAADMYMANLEAASKAKKVEEIMENMIDKAAPAFALKNLKGEEVSLASLKGKVVIVDFWATWCGPCKASFPGMQKAVTKYVDDDNVAFVFIDTWENAKNKEENAQKFIDKHGYTFNVLMDNQSKMVEAYDVRGIPAKFILDKNGHIRFESGGYSGNDEDMINEISTVVEILLGNNTSVRTEP